VSGSSCLFVALVVVQVNMSCIVIGISNAFGFGEEF